MKSKKTRDFTEVLRQKLRADPELAEMVAEEATNSHIATQIYALRTGAGLTQKALADKAGMQQSVIARLEDADYSRYTLRTLQRIARVFNKKIRVEFYDGCPVIQQFETHAIAPVDVSEIKYEYEVSTGA